MNKDDQRTAIAFPGHDAPVASFEDPIAMLLECHNRIRASLELLRKLTSYLKVNGNDAQTARAATDIRRYFGIAAPLHHQDEELHVFPALQKSHVVAIQTYVNRVQADHLRMNDQWLALQTFLVDLSIESSKTVWSQTLEDQVRSFQALHEEHLDIEEQLLFPALVMAASAEDLESMGLEMQQRRSASVSTN
jgi:hemerythrin-like domain-containing protein